MRSLVVNTKNIETYFPNVAKAQITAKLLNMRLVILESDPQIKKIIRLFPLSWQVKN